MYRGESTLVSADKQLKIKSKSVELPPGHSAHHFLTSLIPGALIIHTGLGVYSEGRMNQCGSVQRLVDTGPVTAASLVRNANAVRPDAR